MNEADLKFASPIGARLVPLYGKTAAGQVAVVDAADYELVSRYRWFMRQLWRVDGTPRARYATATQVPTTASRRQIQMHHLVCDYEITDHIDHDGLNNRRSNLRPATKAQNTANATKRAGSSSRFKGVSAYGYPVRWRTQIRISGKTYHLGLFASDVEAARAYDVKALAQWGEYAYTNFPPSDYALDGAA